LWVVEIIAIVIATFVVTVPIQDYALREFKEWLSCPITGSIVGISQQTTR